MLLWQITIMPSLLVITLNGPICTLRKLHLCSWGLLNSIYLTAGKVGRPVVNWLGNSLKLLNISFHISFVCNVVRYPGYLPHLRSNATINIMVGNHLISLELGASTNSCWCFTFVAWPRLPLHLLDDVSVQMCYNNCRSTCPQRSSFFIRWWRFCWQASQNACL